jgi:hypothetical protein
MRVWAFSTRALGPKSKWHLVVLVQVDDVFGCSHVDVVLGVSEGSADRLRLSFDKAAAM